MVISSVRSQHADNAAFQWMLRERAVARPDYFLRHLVVLDCHVCANLDGLLIAGDPGRDVYRDTLGIEEPGMVFTATVLALEKADAVELDNVIEIANGELAASHAVASALSWVQPRQAESRIRALATADTLGRRRIGIEAALSRRLDYTIELEPRNIADASLSAMVLRGIGELGRLDLLPTAELFLKAEDLDVRFSAAWSAALLSAKPEALSALATIAQSARRHRERALYAVMHRADPGAAKVWQRKLAQDAATLRLAVQGAGAIGDPAEIPWLIEQMRTPALARVAGESFTTITGVDIAYQDLEGERADGFESGPTEDPADENVEMDPDENLPWPDPNLIQKWWQSNRSAFQPGTRHLIGKPITIDWCKQVLRIGRQRQRASAALELAMRQPGTPLFEVRAPGFRQKELLGL
jgi:uncharacterized protein (TIGR02270 family)